MPKRKTHCQGSLCVTENEPLESAEEHTRRALKGSNDDPGRGTRGPGRWLGSISFFESMVVDADCLELGLHRPYDHHHILDYRDCVRCDHHFRCVLRFPLSPPGGTGSPL